MNKYEHIVKDICLVSWDHLKGSAARYENRGTALPFDLQVEMEGWIGVSCVLAFLKGVPPDALAMSNHFGAPKYVFEKPLMRLCRNNVFSDEYNAKEDPVLLGRDYDPMTTRRAWCIIAGLASNLCGQINH